MQSFPLSSVAVKPKMKVRPVNTTTIEGRPIMLHCVATGDPAPTIQWDRNNKVDAFDLQRFKVSYLPVYVAAAFVSVLLLLLQLRKKLCAL